MKKEELFEALEDIDPESVKDAKASHRHKRPAWMKFVAMAACAAIIIGAFYGIPALKSQKPNGSNTTNPLGLLTVMAAYPDPVAKAMDAQTFVESDEHWKWWDSYRELVSESKGLQSGINGYYTSIMEKLLVSEDENTVCSPINIYIAFAMLAEVSDGNTRQQILDMLGVTDIETLRDNVSALWKSNYVDTPTLKSLLANSLWLNNTINYNEATMKTLAEKYYASTFSGTPGSEEMNQALRKWTDDNTGGLLTEYTKEMSISPTCVLEILSTIYYKAMWTINFQESNNTKETFHGVSGDNTVDMMHMSDVKMTYRTDNFTSIGLPLSDSGSMYFLLPNEDVDVNILASDPDIMKALQQGTEDSNWSSCMVHMSVPKFKVSGKVDLIETIQALGITDAFDAALSDFTPLTTEKDDLVLSKAEHAAMVEIDEKGVTGAAYTELAIDEGAPFADEEIDFILDRPFMFIVTGNDGSILFSGIVRNIE